MRGLVVDAPEGHEAEPPLGWAFLWWGDPHSLSPDICPLARFERPCPTALRHWATPPGVGQRHGLPVLATNVERSNARSKVIDRLGAVLTAVGRLELVDLTEREPMTSARAVLVRDRRM